MTPQPNLSGWTYAQHGHMYVVRVPLALRIVVFELHTGREREKELMLCGRVVDVAFAPATAEHSRNRSAGLGHFTSTILQQCSFS
ncbi:unnamed protein product [Toxocara canis]|uniref:Uncharacterized protein n=1 Tax=Toxocara canis TaxID=6265 RepID=A0A183US53_TOXCA|nr:unnamed protein product [Toxocara canis]